MIRHPEGQALTCPSGDKTACGVGDGLASDESESNNEDLLTFDNALVKEFPDFGE